MNIIVGFSTGKTILAKLIRWITRSSVSHTYLKMRTTFEKPEFLVYQASGLSVNIENFENFQKHANIIEEINYSVSAVKYEEIVHYMVDKMGRPYSIKQLIGMLWVLFGRSIGLKWRNPFRDQDHSFVCVELICRALDIPRAEELTPQDLLDYLKSHSAEL